MAPIKKSMERKMAKKVLVLLAEGFEEVEAITPVDYLRRAGLDVTTAAVGGSLTVTGSRGIAVAADTTLAALTAQGQPPAVWDAVVVPGGAGGAANLAASAESGAVLRAAAAAGKWVCAICASPAVVLAPLGLLAGKKYTCYPGLEREVRGKSEASGARWSEDSVVVDVSPSGGGLITSRAAGTAGLFAAAIVERLVGGEVGADLKKSVLL
jgi:4-methyl-5(b-hydroxyethyl)-thiazole monophosphate biosynthesis